MNALPHPSVKRTFSVEELPHIIDAWTERAKLLKGDIDRLAWHLANTRGLTTDQIRVSVAEKARSWDMLGEANDAITQFSAELAAMRQAEAEIAAERHAEAERQAEIAAIWRGWESPTLE